MKNKLLIIPILILLLCGCSNKLTCTKKTDHEISKVSLKFKSNVPTSLNWEQKLSYDAGDALIEIDYLDKKENLDKFNNVAGVKYKITKKDRQDKILINVNIDYSLYDISNDLELPVLYSDKTSNKSFLENNGYICK